jgi:predicted ester cyclase
MILEAFPDLQITIEDVIAEGDRVVLRETLNGTLQGELIGNPAAGVHAVWSAVWIYRLAGGRIADVWGPQG